MFGWQIDSKSANDYISLCKECIINDEIFSTFKIQKYYNSILEHADKVCGDKYINFIDKYMDFDNIDNKQYIEDCKKMIYMVALYVLIIKNMILYHLQHYHIYI